MSFVDCSTLSSLTTVGQFRFLPGRAVKSSECTQLRFMVTPQYLPPLPKCVTDQPVDKLSITGMGAPGTRCHLSFPTFSTKSFIKPASRFGPPSVRQQGLSRVRCLSAFVGLFVSVPRVHVIHALGSIYRPLAFSDSHGLCGRTIQEHRESWKWRCCAAVELGTSTSQTLIDRRKRLQPLPA